MRVRQGERECKGGGGAFNSGGASRKYEERTKEEELGAEEREGESAEGRVKGGRSLKGGTHSGRRLSCPFGSWPPRVTAALHGSNAYPIRAIGAPPTHRRSMSLSGGCTLVTYPKPLLRTLNNGYSLRYSTNVTPPSTRNMMVFFQTAPRKIC